MLSRCQIEFLKSIGIEFINENDKLKLKTNIQIDFDDFEDFVNFVKFNTNGDGVIFDGEEIEIFNDYYD